MTLPPHEFRQTLGRFASGVTVITALHAGEKRGMTANAFVSVSLSPPLILVSVDKQASMHAVLEELDLGGSGRFGVSMLSVSQRALSDHFAGRPQPAEVPWFDHQGLPLIAGAVAQLVCRKVRAIDAGDHTLFVGEVEYSRYTDDDPLLYFRGEYHELG